MDLVADLGGGLMESFGTVGGAFADAAPSAVMKGVLVGTLGGVIPALLAKKVIFRE